MSPAAWHAGGERRSAQGPGVTSDGGVAVGAGVAPKMARAAKAAGDVVTSCEPLRGVMLCDAAPPRRGRAVLGLLNHVVLPSSRRNHQPCGGRFSRTIIRLGGIHHRPRVCLGRQWCGKMPESCAMSCSSDGWLRFVLSRRVHSASSSSAPRVEAASRSSSQAFRCRSGSRRFESAGPRLGRGRSSWFDDFVICRVLDYRRWGSPDPNRHGVMANSPYLKWRRARADQGRGSGE